ncbi:hypothetical protein CGZ69_22575 [Streptomyces peucetius subsp. caesius ATCC 27952]|nr:hypothetical protein CGZ69_22575 [Streptomyces peucetius subsp. caesius ATCC 27952]
MGEVVAVWVGRVCGSSAVGADAAGGSAGAAGAAVAVGRGASVRGASGADGGADTVRAGLAAATAVGTDSDTAAVFRCRGTAFTVSVADGRGAFDGRAARSWGCATDAGRCVGAVSGASAAIARLRPESVGSAAIVSAPPTIAIADPAAARRLCFFQRASCRRRAARP